MASYTIGFILFVLVCPRILFAETKSFQAPVFNNLGSFHFLITTKVPAAQRFFDQGVVLYYGFEWGESIRSFREATRLDPECGMCYWGLALALGSKINAPVSGREYQDAKQAIQKALALKNNETTAEQAYINALSIRYQHQPRKVKEGSASVFNCHISNATFDVSTKKEIANYAREMKKITQLYPQDNLAKALYAYSQFDTIRWKFWDVRGKINSLTPELIATLESILAANKLDIGGNHYYVHVMEQSPTPELALDSSDRLQTLVPGSEHLVHMPTHIYFLTGRYHQGTKSNLQAVAVFKEYNKTCRDQGFEPEINYLYFHNYDFLRTTAIMEGRKQLALQAVHDMLLPPFSSWLSKEAPLQWFIPIPYFAKARFGMWEELLNEPKPQEKYQYALGMWHYAQGLALLHADKNLDLAQKESNELNKLIAKGPSDNVLGENGIDLLKIAHNILEATLANKLGNEKISLSKLQAAEKIQLDMGYHEPPDWYFPVSEMLGYAYLKWNHPAQAQQAFERDLKQYPQNGWALFGLAKSLKALGKIQEAEQIEAQYKQAWQYADIEAPVSLY